MKFIHSVKSKVIYPHDDLNKPTETVNPVGSPASTPQQKVGEQRRLSSHQMLLDVSLPNLKKNNGKQACEALPQSLTELLSHRPRFGPTPHPVPQVQAAAWGSFTVLGRAWCSLGSGSSLCVCSLSQLLVSFFLVVQGS